MRIMQRPNHSNVCGYSIQLVNKHELHAVARVTLMAAGVLNSLSPFTEKT